MFVVVGVFGFIVGVVVVLVLGCWFVLVCLLVVGYR